MMFSYFKRFRMEIDLAVTPLPPLECPAGYQLWAWQDRLLEAHARAKYESFCDEMDAHLFPCFGSLAGCQRLMRDITQRAGFLPTATWLAVYSGPEAQLWEPCGTVQGIIDPQGFGSIQNLGVSPLHRRRGLGKALLAHALHGFQQAGIFRVQLEVTAGNLAAIQLYRRIGFRTLRTIYKAVEINPV
ncbi:MAG: GNAT family N-acetyltransferase [Thermoguttaceae bacterium]|nr:GNAT family N-acetyltransferase [Thermoguttaceae bacterium]MDW8036958.1 N-acetyltransferase [Thermoguttaceae bacterium]